MKTMFIYLTENLTNGSKYIGQHVGTVDDDYLGSGMILHQAIKKSGRANFKRHILQICSSKEELNRAEKEWIERFDAHNRNDFYNLTQGGAGGNTLDKLTPEQLDERRKKYYEAMSKLTYDEKEEIRRNRSSTMSKVRQDKELDKQRIKRFKETHYSKPKEEHDKRYNKVRGENNYQSTPVRTPLGDFINMITASKAHGCCSTTVKNRCENPKFSEWKYINENPQ